MLLVPRAPAGQVLRELAVPASSSARAELAQVVRRLAASLERRSVCRVTSVLAVLTLPVLAVQALSLVPVLAVQALAVRRLGVQVRVRAVLSLVQVPVLAVLVRVVLALSLALVAQVLAVVRVLAVPVRPALGAVRVPAAERRTRMMRRRPVGRVLARAVLTARKRGVSAILDDTTVLVRL